MNTIPVMTHPYGRSWEQPEPYRIQLDDVFAQMDNATFEKLYEYSTSIPTGVYAGKMWRARRAGLWYLCWYSDDPDNPDRCLINRRVIKFTDGAGDDSEGGE